MISCPNCGSENAQGHSFCFNCGTALAQSCSACGTPNEPGHRFCFNCGNSLTEAPVVSQEPAAAPPPTSDSGERRLVSVVFADLVGYTTLSEGRDPEDIRSMLTEYYDRCREIIARYGGVTDKFIGDAVMGVFGAESANEDDAERATRTALELVDMVRGLGGTVGMEGLDARAGVMSGEASVGSGGNEHGLVVGDLVNTASRLQSIAPPGGVFVGETTKDLVGSAIEFKSAGSHEVKGKEAPITAYQAARVVAHSQVRSSGELAEGPFVGREDELRLLKDQLHATGREQRARMVSIIGEGGIGKTRLSQELVRYIDGLTEIIYYHNGRSPSYGDGVTFWALGEMIRQRAGILEGEDAAKSRLKLRTMLAEYAPDEEDQRWIEPRLAAVIGLAEMPPGDRSEMYAALRTFFQKIAEQGTVLMVFEDLHWADEGLLDFIEALVERSTSSPILVMSLARPELLDRRQDWGASRRRSLLMHLSRLDDGSMRELVVGLAPGMPAEVAERIASRTAGVPLHAVEFVRMLVNTGQLVRSDGGFQLVDDLEEMAVPDTVSAIISARLDRLGAAEAALIQDASVLGMSFTLAGIADMQGRSTDDVTPVLRSLVKTDVLELDENPRSPERGQYRFVQSLIKEVAYGRLTKQDRVTRHLEVARRMEEVGDPELAGVVASHYASAVAANPDDIELVEKARSSLIASAERARELRSDVQAAEMYRQAVELSADESEAASLKVRLAGCYDDGGRADLAAEVGGEALSYYERVGDQSGVAQAATCIARALSGDFEATKAAEIILPVYRSTPQTDDETWAQLATQTSRALALAGQAELAVEVANESLPALERLEMIEELLDTMINKGTSMATMGRTMEGVGILRGAASLANDHGLLILHLRARNNENATIQNDIQKFEDADEFERLVSRTGNLGWMIRMLFFGSFYRVGEGDLDRALEMTNEGLELELSDLWVYAFKVQTMFRQQMKHGSDPEMNRQIQQMNAPYLESNDAPLADGAYSVLAQSLLFDGDYPRVVGLGKEYEASSYSYPSLYMDAFVAAALSGDSEGASDIVAQLQRQELRGRAVTALLRAGQLVEAALRGETAAAVEFYGEMADLMEAVMQPEDLAIANATAAHVLPAEHPVAIEAASEARGWFTEHGFALYLDMFAEALGRFDDASDEVAV